MFVNLNLYIIFILLFKNSYILCAPKERGQSSSQDAITKDIKIYKQWFDAEYTLYKEHVDLLFNDIMKSLITKKIDFDEHNILECINNEVENRYNTHKSIFPEMGYNEYLETEMQTERGQSSSQDAIIKDIKIYKQWFDAGYTLYKEYTDLLFDEIVRHLLEQNYKFNDRNIVERIYKEVQIRFKDHKPFFPEMGYNEYLETVIQYKKAKKTSGKIDLNDYLKTVIQYKRKKITRSKSSAELGESSSQNVVEEESLQRELREPQHESSAGESTFYQVYDAQEGAHDNAGPQPTEENDTKFCKCC